MKSNSERKQEKRERKVKALRNIPVVLTKSALVELAQQVWNNRQMEGRVSFAPSDKLREAAKAIWGHDIGEVFITASDIRHIKDNHGQNEDKRGQIDIRSDDFAELYDIINDYDHAEAGTSDKHGNKGIILSRGSNGASFSILAERGKQNAEIKTFYQHKKKKVSPMLDAHSPEQNVQNDSVPSSS